MLTFFSSNCSLQSLYILNEVTVDFTARCSEDQVREPSLQASLPLQNPRGFSPQWALAGWCAASRSFSGCIYQPLLLLVALLHFARENNSDN